MKMMIASGHSTAYTTIAALDGLEIMSCRQQEHHISLTVSSLGGEVTESLKDKTEHRKERRRRSYGSVEDQGIETSGNDQLSPSAMRALTLALAVLFMLASGFGVTLTSLRRQIDKSAHSRDEGEGGGIFSSDGKFWLVNPINVTTNGNKPTLTKTEECTGDMQRPVLAGSDLVEYWRLEEGSKPTKGYREINSTYNGYLFLFASAANQHAFEENPEAYLPAFGGFCSFGIAAETVWNRDNLGPFADPSKWKIMPDGTLRVFRSSAPMNKFLLSPDEYAEKGNARWNGWWSGHEAPFNTGCFCAASMCPDM